ncbi:MAG: c-type cytochrome biogenesis protein CcsB [Candidatus Sumerlaeia bacterium]
MSKNIFLIYSVMLLMGFMIMNGASPSYGNDASKAAAESIEIMPVQDAGFIRSGITFAENHLAAITGRTTHKRQKALPLILELLAQPEKRQTMPLLKIQHPDLGELYGSKWISLETYRDPVKMNRLSGMLQRNQNLMRIVQELEVSAQRIEELDKDFAIIAPEDAASPDAEWLSPARMRETLENTGRDADPKVEAILEHWDKLRAAIAANNVDEARQIGEEMAAEVEELAITRGAELPNLKLDAFYHDWDPFKVGALFYLFATLVYLASLVFKKKRLAWGGIALLIAGLFFQSIGIAARWIISGRAPLSNMYESYTFAVAGFVLVAIIFEWIYHMRLVGFGAALLGFTLMILAHNAPIFDSKITPLMPALQSSWLTYHVVTIMLSYSAFLLSFFTCIVYLVKDIGGGNDSRFALLRQAPSLETLERVNYKIIAVGFPLLTLGIVLGAVWANTAWGRPWGWDPKETWSAITWLVYAAYLHVRYLSGWRGRGSIILSIIGFACVLFTYFGVNYLLSGLHSYA